MKVHMRPSNRIAELQNITVPDAESVSIIIPTRNRRSSLESTVRTIVSQTVLPTELLIIDQSANDRSERAVQAVLISAPENVRATIRLVYIRDPSISGGAVARNRAMEMASGETWLFLDDDVDLEPDFIEQILAAYHRYPEAVGVSGVVTNYGAPGFSSRLWSRLFCTGPFWDERQPIYWKATKGIRGKVQKVRKFGAGLMSFRASAIRTHRFDATLKGVSDGEDVDFCARLDRSSVLLITPSARLVHKQSPVGRSREHWLVRHARTAGYLYRRNWAYGIRNRLAFAWLNCGYLTVAIVNAIRRGSTAPFFDYRRAIQESKALVH